MRPPTAAANPSYGRLARLRTINGRVLRHVSVKVWSALLPPSRATFAQRPLRLREPDGTSWMWSKCSCTAIERLSVSSRVVVATNFQISRPRWRRKETSEAMERTTRFPRRTRSASDAHQFKSSSPIETSDDQSRRCKKLHDHIFATYLYIPLEMLFYALTL